MMYRDEETWFALMNHLVDISIDYVVAQVEAGAEIIQILILGWCTQCEGLSLLY